MTFVEGTSAEAIGSALSSAGVKGTPIDGTTTVVVDAADLDHATLTEAFQDDPAVETVEPNLVRRAARIPDDPQVPAQRTYLDTVRLPAAWDVAVTVAGVTVAVLDTGVDLDHPDLVPNLVPGYNALAPAATPQDDNGHGTQVAGVIGAVTDNATAVAGVAWNARIMPVKVLDAEGAGTDAQISTGIRWAVDNGADIVNLSFSGPGGSSALSEALSHAREQGVLVVASGGNTGGPGTSFPAGSSVDLPVTATDQAGTFASFSSNGRWVGISAPGISIPTTALAPGASAATTTGTGTSIAAAVVSGVAALVVERHSSWTTTQVARALFRTATDAGIPGWDDHYGSGVVNAAAALDVAPVPAVSQPALAGDAGNMLTAARLVPTGTTTTETLAYEGDEDWFAFDVPSGAGVTITVTPPAAAPFGTRAREVDPVVDVYGPGNGILASEDPNPVGQAEVVQFNAAAGRHRVRVRNYLGAAGPAPYSLRVQLSGPVPDPNWALPVTAFDSQAPEGGVAIADVTGDGRADAIVSTTGAEPDGNSLVVLAQQADGTFAAPRRLPLDGTTTRGQQLRPLTGDFDGDGDDDLFVATDAGLEVAWNGDGGLEDLVVVAQVPGVKIVADLDGAGGLELVDGTDQVRRWDGSGLAVVEQLGFAASHAADVTGDGRVDLFAIERLSDDRLVVHARRADGSWAPAVAVELGPNVWVYEVATGDVTGDGLTDVLITDQDSSVTGHALLTLVQRPDGTLAPPTRMDSASNPRAVGVGDVTGDGRDDVVVLHDWTAGIYRQRPNGTLAPEKPLDMGHGTWNAPLALGDVDDDGVDDLAVLAGALTIVRHGAAERRDAGLVSTSPAPYATGVSTTAPLTMTFAAPINLDGFDSRFQLVEARSGRAVARDWTVSGQTITVTPREPLAAGTLYELELVNFWSDVWANHLRTETRFTTAAGPPPTYSVGTTYAPFDVDIDGNGYDDVLWHTPSTAADPLWVFDGGGKRDTSTSVSGTFRPVAGDFDGNGAEDVFWYAPGAATDTMWFNTPVWDGQWQTTTVALPVSGTYVPVVGDFDRNGYDDIFWYGPGGTAESLWAFRAGRQYTAVPQPAANATTYRLVAGDFTRDGYDDILWHTPGTGAESLWKGGPSGFTPGPTSNANGHYDMRAGDFDGDGFDDVYFYATGVASLWRGGATGFTAQAAPTVAATAVPVAGDFTGDGRSDLLAYVPGTTADRLIPGKDTGL